MRSVTAPASVPTVTVCIPTLNEVESVRPVLVGCKPFADELLVVDGGSTDGTVELALEHGARVIQDNGRGKGAALRQAIDEASCDIIAFIDADGSHDPADLEPMLAPLKAGEADIVVGSRTRGGSDELQGDLEKFFRMIGSDIITMGINYRFGVRLTDSQNGFRAMTVACGKDLDLAEDIFTIEQEMLLKAMWRGKHVIEIPTREYERTAGHSRIVLRRVAPRYVWVLLKYLAVSGRPRGKSLPGRWGTVERR